MVGSVGRNDEAIVSQVGTVVGVNNSDGSLVGADDKMER